MLRATVRIGSNSRQPGREYAILPTNADDPLLLGQPPTDNRRILTTPKPENSLNHRQNSPTTVSNTVLTSKQTRRE